jgi:hypothetical protein
MVLTTDDIDSTDDIDGTDDIDANAKFKQQCKCKI